jgi:DNA-binding GntR family transcriptional regulator
VAERHPNDSLGENVTPLPTTQSTETALAHERIRQAILNGELAAGTVLKQGELAERYDVGRTPLREALRLLEREGLVEAEPQRRARVAGFSVDDLEELYAMRIELETLAVRYTVPRLSEEDLRKLADHLARMEEAARAEDYEGWQGPHRAFHSGLVARAGERLLGTVSLLSDHAERYRHVYTVETPRGWATGIPEHRAILEAAEAGDPAAAAERLARHYGTVSLGLLTVMAPEHEPALLRTALRSAIRPVGASEGRPT